MPFSTCSTFPAPCRSCAGCSAPAGSSTSRSTSTAQRSSSPPSTPQLDARIEAAYHRTMDERITGRSPLRRQPHRPPPLSATWRRPASMCWQPAVPTGSCFPSHGRYPADEAYFLHFIVHTMHGALCNDPAVAGEDFERWIAARHAQIERGELIYIAHQTRLHGPYLAHRLASEGPRLVTSAANKGKQASTVLAVVLHGICHLYRPWACPTACWALPGRRCSRPLASRWARWASCSWPARAASC